MQHNLEETNLNPHFWVVSSRLMISQYISHRRLSLSLSSLLLL